MKMMDTAMKSRERRIEHGYEQEDVKQTQESASGWSKECH